MPPDPDAMPPASPAPPPPPPSANRRPRLMLWVALAFALQIGIWTAWLIVAARHQPAEVPLATAPARP